MTLRETQRRMAAAIMQPLTSSGRVAKRTRGGEMMTREAASFIKPNDRLSPVERLEIYSRSYWCRLLDSLKEDFPGLEAVLGSTGFERLAIAYLDDCPSRSFTLRDLGSRLESWLLAHPDYAGRKLDLALDMVRLEWAHITAFDGPEENVLGPEDLAELRPASRLGVQPYITLLQVSYAVDELRSTIKATEEGRKATSNLALLKRQRAVRREQSSKPERIFLAVHRFDSMVYYRRLSRKEFRLLEALQARRSFSESIRTVLNGTSEKAGDIAALLKTWFATWAQLGWLTVPSKYKKERRSS